MRKNRLSNKELKKLVIAAEEARIAALPDPQDVPPHQFSPEFEAKMTSLCEAMRHHEKTGTSPIWDEDTQRYI